MFRKVFYSIFILTLISAFVLYKYGRNVWVPVLAAATGEQTVGAARGGYERDAQARLGPFFQKANVKYPPDKIALIAIKNKKILELWASANTNNPKLIKTYPILAASGKLGPKLKEGDAQVPEGLYRITSLNPYSRFHLSMRVSYPNEFDKKNAENEGRTDLGGDIYIHGNAVSIGCIAIGDVAIEELFVLVSKTKMENVSVIIAPADFRNADYRKYIIADITWTAELYKNISNELKNYVKE